MNYLAHLYLADADPLSLIGSLMGDFAKGPVDERWAPAVREGIRLHRKIDAFTDAHPVVQRSKQRLRPQFRRYGGILIDVFYDHFLARDWVRYSSLTLSQFTRYVYAVFATHYRNLPARMQRSVAHMIAVDLLGSYQKPTGIGHALAGIEQRLQRPSGLPEAMWDLASKDALLAADFAEFFPELIDYVAQQAARGTIPPADESLLADRPPGNEHADVNPQNHLSEGLHPA